MELTNFQKELLIAIKDKRVKDLRSFYDIFGKVTWYDEESEHNVNGISVEPTVIPYIIPSDEEDLLKKLKGLYVLRNILEKEGLALLIQNPQSNVIHKVCWVGKEANDTNYQAVAVPGLNIFADQINKIEFIPTPELGTFIKNGFKTKDEIKDDRTRKAQWTTATIGFIGIFATIMIAIINIFLYTTERSVKVTNENAFTDTIKVEILKLKDTLNIKNQDSIIIIDRK